jgi:hypothetical protein
MPIPRTQNAPLFNGRYVNDFLSLIAQHGANAGITKKDELVPYILQYSSDRVKDMIRYDPAFDPDVAGKTWKDAKAGLTMLFGHADEAPDYNEAMLREFCQERNAKSPFSTKEEIEIYVQEFSQIAGPLVKKSKITDKERDFYFIAGIPEDLKDWFNNKVPVANRKRSDPPKIAESVRILQRRFDQDSLTYKPWGETPARRERQVTFGADGNIQGTPFAPSINTAPAHNPVQTVAVDHMEQLTRQLEQLHINLAAMKLGTAQQQLTDQSSQNPQIGPQRHCFMCGKAGEHPLHPSRCPETRFLLDSNTIKFDTITERYVMLDGSDLPRIPKGFVGGVAGYIRALQRDQAASQGTKTARTNSIGLSYGSSRVLNDRIFAVSSLDVQDRLAEPVTRTGRDTGVRFDPARRLEGGKGKERETERVKPPSTVPKPAANPPNTTLPAPPPNPINRQEGWKDSRPSNSKPQSDDVVMRDAKRPGPADKYHITSTIQERADTNAVFEGLLKMPATLPLLQLIGISPGLQKLFSEATRARREYGGKQAEYFIDGNQTNPDTFVKHFQGVETGIKEVHALESDDYSDFLVRYGNAIAKVPEGRYFAMSTGSLTISIGDTELTAMIDSGSELNLAGKSVPARCGLAVDFEGMKWALKGIHGGPEQLRGCATDAPIKIGGRDFPHHLFISHQELGQHDLILGQPFLQWFAARLDYERSGGVSLYLWKDGDRKVHPTIVVTITDPSDPRNTTTITRGHSHQAWVEEVPDDEESF